LKLFYPGEKSETPIKHIEHFIQLNH